MNWNIYNAILNLKETGFATIKKSGSKSAGFTGEVRLDEDAQTKQEIESIESAISDGEVPWKLTGWSGIVENTVRFQTKQIERITVLDESTVVIILKD